MVLDRGWNLAVFMNSCMVPDKPDKGWNLAVFMNSCMVQDKPDKGWNLAVFINSCMVPDKLDKGWNLAVFMNSCMVPDKDGWKSGYIHIQISTHPLAQTCNYKLWWSYSATFMCYEYSCMQHSIL